MPQIRMWSFGLSEWSVGVLSALQRGPCRHLSLSENVIKAPATVQHVGPLDRSFAAPPVPPRARHGAAARAIKLFTNDLGSTARRGRAQPRKCSCPPRSHAQIQNPYKHMRHIIATTSKTEAHGPDPSKEGRGPYQQ